MSGPEGGPAREATLEAVHADQMQMQDQLRELSDLLTRTEQHLMGGPHAQMIGAAAAQEKASLGIAPPLGQGGLLQPPQPPMPGLLPQMCELGLNNSHAVSDMQSRLSQVSRLLGVANA